MAKKSQKVELIRYPLDYNPVIEYYNKIKSSEILVSKKVERVYQELVRKINDSECEFKYDATKANKAIEFVENFCKHSKGEWARKKIILELWQKALIAATFGMVDKETGYRMIQELVLIIPRKAGKSTLGSAIALYLLIADGENGSEVVAVATKRDQAKRVWDESVKMIKKSPTLYRRIKCRVNMVKHEASESDYKPVASDSNSLDGLNLHGSFMDEIHAWTDKNLYDVIVDSMSTRKQPLNFIMSTAGYVREGIYDIKYKECESIIRGYDTGNYTDNTVLPIIYELDDAEEIHDESMWYKANPTLGTVKSLSFIRKNYNKAIEDSVNMPNLLTKDFNIRHNGEVTWLNYQEIHNEATFNISELKPRYAIGGGDLSNIGDLTSASIIFKLPNDDTLYVETMYWMPEDTLEEHIRSDDVPYDIWAEKGYLRLCKGNIVNYEDVTAWFLELQRKYGVYLYMVGYDRWQAGYWVKEMKDNFGEHAMKDVAQGAKTFSMPMKTLGAMLKSKKVNYNNNPITQWCLMNTVAKIDDNENIRPVKGSNSKKRIDGTVSILDAFAVMLENKHEYEAMI